MSFTMHRRATSTLPHPLTPFIGRVAEIAAINRLLADPTCRLLTLLGQGGMGKTRLAIEIAAGQLDSHADGVCFVALAGVESADHLAAAVADALGIPATNQGPVSAQLESYLVRRELLLVLDNFEHLLAAGEELVAWLGRAPRLRIMVTSRQPLNLREEWLYPLVGLAMPARPTTRDAAPDVTSDAMQLFAATAVRVQPAFDVAAHGADVASICRLVGGMPLALELAAAWTKSLTCAEILAEIERDLAFLASRQRNLPERHRSIQAVFDQSWQQLSEQERTIFRAVSIFRRGFDRAAASAVASASLLDLAALQERALVQRDSNGRYTLHELIRQFAAEKLAEAPAHAREVEARHTAYYLAYVRQRHVRLLGPDEREALQEIDREIDNVRAAWTRAVEQHDWRAIDAALDGYTAYHKARGYFAEGRSALVSAGEKLSNAERAAGELECRVALRRASFALALGDYSEAEALLAVAHSPAGKGREEALYLHLRGITIDGLYKDWVQAEQCLLESLAIYQASGDLAGQAMTLDRLAGINSTFGNFTVAEEQATQAVTVARSQGQPTMLAEALMTLGWIVSCVGRWDFSVRSWSEAYDHYRRLGSQFGMAVATNFLGWSAWCRGAEHLDTAIRHHEEALAVFRDTGAQISLSMALGDLALALVERGESERAYAYALESIAIVEQTGNVHHLIYGLTCAGAAATAAAAYASARGYLQRSLALAREHQVVNNADAALAIYCAAELLQAEARAGHRAADSRRKQVLALQLYRAVAEHHVAWRAVKERAHLRTTALEAILRPGEVAAALTPAPDFVSLARQIVVDDAFFGELPRGTVGPDRAYQAPMAQQSEADPQRANRALPEPLTARELEVLSLIAGGLTNQQIADQLIIARGTVKYYASQIYGKLGVRNRTQAIIRARELSLLPF